MQLCQTSPSAVFVCLQDTVGLQIYFYVYLFDAYFVLGAAGIGNHCLSLDKIFKDMELFTYRVLDQVDELPARISAVQTLGRRGIALV